MQFNSSLNKQESILALTQATKEQKVQELSLSVTQMSPDGVCVQAGDWVKERKKRLLRTISTKVSHLVSFGFLSGLVPRPLARYKSNWSTVFRYFEHSCNGWAWAKSWHLNGETKRRWRRKTKRCERLTSMRTIMGERRPYDRYNVRSRDYHATDEHVS